MRRLNERKEDFDNSLERLRERAAKSNFPKHLTTRIIANAAEWKEIFPPSTNNNNQEYRTVPWATAHPKLLQLY